MNVSPKQEYMGNQVGIPLTVSKIMVIGAF
jgi:hypothetical protein